MRRLLQVLSLALLLSVVSFGCLKQVPAQYSGPGLHWSGSVEISWLESAVSGVVYLRTSRSIPTEGAQTTLTEAHPCHGKRRLMVGDSVVHAKPEGIDRLYRALLGAYLSGHTVNFNVYWDDNRKQCRIERVQLKL